MRGYVFLLAGILSTAAGGNFLYAQRNQAQQPQKDKREIESLSSTFETGSVKLKITSEVYPIGPINLQGPEMYSYIYIFENRGKRRVKVLLLSGRILTSPLTQILQDFAVEINEGEKKVVAFITNSEPKVSWVAHVIAEWIEEKRIWRFLEGGFGGLNFPSRHGDFWEINQRRYNRQISKRMLQSADIVNPILAYC